MLSKADILKNLETFQVAQGKIVSVHSSLKAVGELEGGGETLLLALIEFFTEKEGVLCIPTHTWDSDVYDMRKAESCTGVLSCLAAGHPDGIRTAHPTHSVALFGNRKKVEEIALAEENSVTPASPSGCMGRLYNEDGYVLLIGVGQNKNTFLHCVEEMLFVPNRLTKEKIAHTVIYLDGRKEIKSIYCFDEENFCDASVFFGKFEPAFRYHGAIIDGRIGDAKVQLCRARKMKEVVELIYRNNHFKELLDNDLPLVEHLYK